MSVESIVSIVKDKEVLIEDHRLIIKDLYESLNTQLQQSGGIRTSEVDNTYKNIDRVFGIKAKLEAEVRDHKKNILNLLLGE